jgi:hypothetical protein
MNAVPLTASSLSRPQSGVRTKLHSNSQAVPSVQVPLSHEGTRHDLLRPIPARKLATCAL